MLDFYYIVSAYNFLTEEKRKEMNIGIVMAPTATIRYYNGIAIK